MEELQSSTVSYTALNEEMLDSDGDSEDVAARNNDAFVIDLNNEEQPSSAVNVDVEQQPIPVDAVNRNKNSSGTSFVGERSCAIALVAGLILILSLLLIVFIFLASFPHFGKKYRALPLPDDDNNSTFDDVITSPLNNSLANLTYDFSNEESSYNCELTPQCRDRLAVMDHYMNQNADPCDNFYEYSCGNFKKLYSPNKNFQDGVLMMGDVISESTRRRLLEVLENEKSPLIVTETHRKIQRYFKACSKPDKERNLAAGRQIIDAMGGFRLLGPNEKRPTPDFSNTLASSIKFSSTSNSLFAVKTEPDKNSTSSFRVVIEADFSPSSWPYNSTDLDRISRKYLPSDLQFSDDEIQRIVDFRDFYWFNAANLANESSSVEVSRKTSISVGELKIQCGQIDWEKLLATVSNLTRTLKSIESIQLILQKSNNFDFLSIFCRFLGRVLKTENGRRLMHNYLVFSAILPHFSNNIGGDKKKSECLDDVINKFTLGVNSIFLYQNSTLKKTTSMFAEIWKEFHRKVVNSKFVKKRTKALMWSKLNTLRYEMGMPEWAFDKTQLDDYYGTLEITSSSVRNSVNFYRREQFENAALITLEELAPLDKVNAWLELDINKIYIWSGILQPPVYDYSLTDSLNFGGIGSVFGHELGHILADEIKPGSDLFLESYKHCIIDYYATFSYDNAVKSSCSITVSDDMSDIIGLHLAFSVFKSLKSYAKQAPNFVLPSSRLKLDKNKAFFISFAQSLFCDFFTEEAMKHFVSRADHSLGPFRVNGAVSQVAEFSEAFKCPLGSKLNPVKRCQLL